VRTSGGKYDETSCRGDSDRPCNVLTAVTVARNSRARSAAMPDLRLLVVKVRACWSLRKRPSAYAQPRTMSSMSLLGCGVYPPQGNRRPSDPSRCRRAWRPTKRQRTTGRSHRQARTPRSEDRDAKTAKRRPRRQEHEDKTRRIAPGAHDKELTTTGQGPVVESPQ
jgi:hypothetical protein